MPPPPARHHGTFFTPLTYAAPHRQLTAAFTRRFQAEIEMGCPQLNLVLCSLPCYGHAKPLVILAEHLAEAGHQVRGGTNTKAGSAEDQSGAGCYCCSQVERGMTFCVCATLQPHKLGVPFREYNH